MITDLAKSTQSPLTGIMHRKDVQPLNTDEIQFEIDMCIGCDRCMRACPVPLSSQIPIVELNQATISGQMTPQIARFTTECVMCGSCVPVCPVDNHRDLLMLSLKQRLGTTWNAKADTSQIKAQLPLGWDISQLLERLREQPMFQDMQQVPDNYLLHCVAASKLLALPQGEVILREDEFGRDIYFILRGQIELSLNNAEGQSMPNSILQRGEYMGEQSMLTGQPHSFTATAATAALVLQVSEQVMQHLIEITPSLQEFFDQVNTPHFVETTLKRIPLFQDVSNTDLRQLTEWMQLVRYERGEKLFDEMDRPEAAKQRQSQRETLHILLEGFVSVARRTKHTRGTEEEPQKRIIAYRQAGDYFIGGLDMLGDKHSVSVSAITRVTVAEFSRRTMLVLFERYPTMQQYFQERLQLYKDTNAAANSWVFEPGAFTSPETTNTLSQPEARAGLHALVDDGVIEGTDILVIDLDKCVHCNECEEACARRHGHSRMNRQGMIISNISITTSCRQCQDPVCLLCSRAGIARHPSGEVYITESCIGCGICAERCPYNNISIVTLDQQEKTEQASWQKFVNFFTPGKGKEQTKQGKRKALPLYGQTAPLAGPLGNTKKPDALTELRKKIAVKCDLCAGYNNQACVQACPVGAAIRVNPVTFFGSTEDILSRRLS